MKNFANTLLFCLALPLIGQAADRFSPSMPSFRGFIQVRPDRELFVDYVAPKPGKPLAILLNGMTYSTRQWDSYTRELLSFGVGVLRFDFDGMGQTLLKYAPSTAPYMFDQQTRDLKTLLTVMSLRPPYNLVGLSYGGGIALSYGLSYPRDVKNLILMAPFTEPLEAQDTQIRRQIAMTRATFPANPATDDELYDFFLRQSVYTTYPSVEPIVLENPYKLEATFNLVRGIRKFRAVDYADRLPFGTVHLMVAAYDQYIPGPTLEKFWSKVAPAARMSRIKVFETEHKMPEAVPLFSARWTWQILKGNPLLRGGADFQGWALMGTVKTSNGQPVPIND